MVKVGLFVRLEAKSGKEKEVEKFLNAGLALVNEEPATTAWFAIRMEQTTFGILMYFLTIPVARRISREKWRLR
jgi:hypothetical protein